MAATGEVYVKGLYVCTVREREQIKMMLHGNIYIPRVKIVWSTGRGTSKNER